MYDGHYVNKQCERCGAQMVHVFHTARYCPNCRKAVDREYHRRKHREARLRKEKEKPMPTGDSLHDVVARAKAAGLSYGQQVWFELWQKELVRRGKKIA